MTGITPLILTFNEAPNIARALNSLQWANEVVIVDSFSTDETLEVARTIHSGVRVVQRAFDTHAAQWNFGVDQIESKWVLALDADYVISSELAREIQMIESPGDVVGYSARFHYCIYGTRLHGSLYPGRTVLFHKTRGRYVDEGHTQVWRPEGAVLPLTDYIDHDDRKPLARWVTSQVKYGQIEARHLLAARPAELTVQDRLRLRIYFAPIIVFFYLVIVRGLIRDGWRGWYYIAQRTIAELILSICLLVEKHGLEFRSNKELPESNQPTS